MSHAWKRHVLKAVCAALWTMGAAGAASAAPVTTDAGALEGSTTKGVTAYLGVSFAAPPVGDLRWRAPQPVQPWSGVRKADGFSPDCMQRPLDYVPGPGYIRPISEDCLYLNIWKPAAPPTAKPLPVMVWIYGGAFTMGSGAWPAYNGRNLAAQGVILITLNYRLGRFGFFGHPALSKADADGVLANYGLMDQMAALKWVRRNVAAFGGDPHNVTIFGESAGGFSVNALLASPLARGLFDKAISESGGGQKGLGALPDRYLAGGPRSAEAEGAAWARSVGVKDDDLKALRALPAEVVLGPQNPRVSASFIVDGKIIPKPVDEVFLEGGQAQVPYIVGANSDEQSLLQWLPDAADQGLKTMGPYGEQALALYEEGGAVDRKTAEAKLWGDAFMVGPARFLAGRMASTATPTWLYHYSYVPKASRGKVPGAGHAAEISLVFHNEIDAPYFAENASDGDMARQVSGYWVRFAETGDPNGAGEPVWPRYDAGTDRLLDFKDDGPVVETQFEKDRLDLLDKSYASRVHPRG